MRSAGVIHAMELVIEFDDELKVKGNIISEPYSKVLRSGSNLEGIARVDLYIPKSKATNRTRLIQPYSTKS